jgi:quercetin dioxygenase-like cupin family protein
MSRFKIDFSSIDWESPIEGVRQKVITDGNKIIRLVEYSPKMPLHWCEKGHFGYILEGRLEIEFPDGAEVFESGDGVFIPDGHAHRHQARALSNIVTVVLVEDV